MAARFFDFVLFLFLFFVLFCFSFPFKMCIVGLYVSLCLMIFLCPFLHCKALRTAMYKRYINSIIILFCVFLQQPLRFSLDALSLNNNHKFIETPGRYRCRAKYTSMSIVLLAYWNLPACRRLLFPLLHAGNKGNGRRLHAGNIEIGEFVVCVCLQVTSFSLFTWTFIVT